MRKQVSVSLPLTGDSHDDEYEDTPELLDQLLANYEKPEDLTGEGGLFKQLKKALIERALGAELTEHLGYEKGDLGAAAATAATEHSGQIASWMIESRDQPLLNRVCPSRKCPRAVRGRSTRSARLLPPSAADVGFVREERADHEKHDGLPRDEARALREARGHSGEPDWKQ
jgi:hypothetical protein